MTLDKEKYVTLPQWALSGLVSIILAGVTTWGVISAKAATLELRATHNENNIERLQESKVSRDEFNLVLEQLNRIEKKLDEHTKETK